MANGYTDKEMIDKLYAGQEGIQRQLAALMEKVDRIMVAGCAHRTDDLRRIEELEGWRTKGIVGTIGLFIMAIAALFRRM
ncbi:hypothetical protein M0Q28_05815 [Patescibacteria group bacterium]|jgi:hypothetical protein|nr:hypothetical protein [Patescibacteria group bacterium]